MIGKPQQQQHLQLQRSKPQQQSLDQPTSPTAITSSDTDEGKRTDLVNNKSSGYDEREEDEEEEEGEEEEELEDEDEEEEDELEEEDGQQDPSSPPLPVEFSVGELVWGAARGHPSLPGKVVSAPRGASGDSSSDAGGDGTKSKKKNNKNKSVWVRWFGGRPVIELVPMESLKSLSEGLDAHHKALKDTRK